MKRTEEEARRLVESMKRLQEEAKEGEFVFPCPRCGRHQMNVVAVRNSLSRHADVYVCNDCGTDEAIRDMTGNVLPLSEWSMSISF